MTHIEELKSLYYAKRNFEKQIDDIIEHFDGNLIDIHNELFGKCLYFHYEGVYLIGIHGVTYDPNLRSVIFYADKGYEIWSDDSPYSDDCKYFVRRKNSVSVSISDFIRFSDFGKEGYELPYYEVVEKDAVMGLLAKEFSPNYTVEEIDEIIDRPGSKGFKYASYNKDEELLEEQ